MTTSCLEMVTFKLADGADREAFLAGAPVITDWASRQPGFQYRTLVEKGDGIWSDLIWWASKEEALAASDKIMAELGGAPFMQMIDPMSVEMGHHPVAHMSAGG